MSAFRTCSRSNIETQTQNSYFISLLKKWKRLFGKYKICLFVLSGRLLPRRGLLHQNRTWLIKRMKKRINRFSQSMDVSPKALSRKKNRNSLSRRIWICNWNYDHTHLCLSLGLLFITTWTQTCAHKVQTVQLRFLHDNRNKIQDRAWK